MGKQSSRSSKTCAALEALSSCTNLLPWPRRPRRKLIGRLIRPSILAQMLQISPLWHKNIHMYVNICGRMPIAVQSNPLTIVRKLLDSCSRDTPLRMSDIAVRVVFSVPQVQASLATHFLTGKEDEKFSNTKSPTWGTESSAESQLRDACGIG